MKTIAAYLLLVLGGKTEPTVEDVTSFLGEIGVDAESESIERLVTSLAGKNLEELIAEGMEKVGSVSVGAGAPAASGAAATEEAAAEEEEEEEEEEDVGVGGLFGDDSDDDW